MGENLFGAHFFAIDIDFSSYLIYQKPSAGKFGRIVFPEYFLRFGRFHEISFRNGMLRGVFLSRILLDGNFRLEIRIREVSVEHDIEFRIPFSCLFHRDVEIFTCDSAFSIPDIRTAFGSTIKRKNGDVLPIEASVRDEDFPDVREEIGLPIELLERVGEFISILEKISDFLRIMDVEHVVETREEVGVLKREHLLEGVGIVFARYADPKLRPAPEGSVFRFALTRFELYLV